MPTVAVIGAGTMGAGIAQVAATAGWDVLLFDVSRETAQRAIDQTTAALDRLVDKGRLDAARRDAALERLRAASDPAECAPAELLIEAVVEDLDRKIRILRPYAAAAPAALLASNTSSLSIAAIGAGLDAGPRTVGMHFFNPVPLMPLVEIIAALTTTAAAAERATAIAKEWGKTPVRVADTPGFIVNRVARGYYLEALRMLGEGVAGVDEIDRSLKSLGGFRMGPFELMDLIGIDVNYSVSGSVWEQLGRPARLAPHPIQRKLVEQGCLGRKSGRGFYDYSGPAPLPAVQVARASFELPSAVYEAVRRFAAGATESDGSITEQYTLSRCLGAIINEAALLRDAGAAAAADIDTAMKLGTNYPRGPFEWADRIGRHTCASLLRSLNSAAEGYFEPAAGLCDPPGAPPTATSPQAGTA